MLFIFKWNDEGKLDSYYLKKNESLLNNVSGISVPTKNLILGDLVFFATIVGKKNMPKY